MTMRYDRLTVYGAVDQAALGKAILYYHIVQPEEPVFTLELLRLFPMNEQSFTRFMSQGRRRVLHFSVNNVYADIPYMPVTTKVRAILSAYPDMPPRAIALFLGVDVRKIYPLTKKSKLKEMQGHD